ncbi:DUF3108 domain-containing protein [Salinibacter altiplanensis]|uniref:DUF3108 domain-containing protein n=1 Tax=Salinibacter altiplanensis TaxID=1803181 RepID=UPI00131A54C7|nr:DUF3108 domain-containing protein [Salinibacter altiplanensis]
MTQRIPRSLLTLLCAALLPAAMIVPAAAQERTGPPGELSGFENIDGTALKPAVLSYDATMKMGGKSVDLSSALTVTATSTGEADVGGTDTGGTDTWTLVNKIKTPRGTNTDSLIMDRSTLLPVSRHRRGGRVMDLTYAGPSASGKTEVSGKIETGGQSKPIRTGLEGPTLASGVHDILALAAMSLKPGFRAALRVFSPQDQATKRAEFEVVGTETVETPAGSFETYVVNLNVGDGYVTGTVHLRKEAPHYYVKWKTEMSSDRGTRTVTQTLSSMEMHAAPSGK